VFARLRYFGGAPNDARANSSNVSVPSWLLSSWSKILRAGLSEDTAAAGRSGGIAVPGVVPVVDVDVPLLASVEVPMLLLVPVADVEGVVEVEGDFCAVPGVALPVSPPALPVSAATAVPAKPSAEAMAPHISVRRNVEFIV
jgi:hypothetical protein